MLATFATSHGLMFKGRKIDARYGRPCEEVDDDDGDENG